MQQKQLKAREIALLKLHLILPTRYRVQRRDDQHEVKRRKQQPIAPIN